jgi:hypothetical protein
MRCLYRTVANAATSNEGTAPVLGDIAAGEADKGVTVEQFKYAVFPANRPADVQAPECLVCVDQRHAKRVSEMLLREWKLDTSVFDQPALFGAHVQVQQQIGGALERRATAEADQILVDKLLFARSEPRNIKSQ